MILKFRNIKNPKCKCPCPPYLHIELFHNGKLFRWYYGGITCICDIIEILDNI